MSWTRTFFIRFCAVLMLFTSVKMGVFYTFYTVDRQDFVQMFCENKERPEMKCNGKCHMKKVMKSNSEDDKKTNEFNFQVNEIPLFFEEISYFIFLKEVKIRTNNFSYANFYYFSLE